MIAEVIFYLTAPVAIICLIIYWILPGPPKKKREKGEEKTKQIVSSNQRKSLTQKHRPR